MPVYKKRYSPKKRLRKRGWSLSAGVSGYGVSAGMKFEKRALANFVKSSILEPKLITLNTATTSVLDSTVYTMNITNQIPQGNTSTSRVGDKIFLKSINTRIHIDVGFAAFPAGTASVKYRCLIFKSDTYFNLSNLSIAGFATTDLFQPSNAPVYSRFIDYQNITVVCDKTISINAQSGINTGTVTRDLDIKCPVKKSFLFERNSVKAKAINYYLCVIPYAYGATPGTTIDAYFTPTINISFTD